MKKLIATVGLLIICAVPGYSKMLKCEVVDIMASDLANSITTNLEEDMVLIRCKDTTSISNLQPGQKIKVKIDKKKAIEGC
jgi:methyl coenzyme M reductase beta subunit